MSSREQQVTVGVALPIPPPWGNELQRQRTEYGEARAANIPTHITLLPPTPVSHQQGRDLREHLVQVAGRTEPFPVLLRGTGTFRPISDVVFIQVALGVARCEQLEQEIRSGPVQRTLEFPYHPHVTVAHDLPSATLDRAFDDLARFSCEFQAEVIRMYVHHGDEKWEPVEEFALTGSAHAT